MKINVSRFAFNTKNDLFANLTAELLLLNISYNS